MPKMIDKVWDNRERRIQREIDKEKERLALEVRELRYLNMTNKEQLDNGLEEIRAAMCAMQIQHSEMKEELRQSADKMQEDVAASIEGTITELEYKLNVSTRFLDEVKLLEQQVQDEQRKGLERIRFEMLQILEENAGRQQELQDGIKKIQKRMKESQRDDQDIVLNRMEQMLKEGQQAIDEKLETHDRERRREYEAVRTYLKTSVWILLINLMLLALMILGIFN